MWVYGNLYIIAGIATVVAVAQVILNFSFIYTIIFFNYYDSVTAFCDFLGKNSRGTNSTSKIIMDALNFSLGTTSLTLKDQDQENKHLSFFFLTFEQIFDK